MSLANANLDLSPPYACMIEVGQTSTEANSGYDNCRVPEYWRLQPNLAVSGDLQPGQRVLRCAKSVIAASLVGAGQDLDLTSCDWKGFDQSYQFQDNILTDLSAPSSDFYVNE